MTPATPATTTGSSSPSVRFDLPEPDAFTQAYWDAAAEGKLLLRHCGGPSGCGRSHHYPREFCPHCWNDSGVRWVEAEGVATLYTWSVVHRNDLPPFGGRTPYVAAVVDLAEGPRMMTEVVECPEERLRVGMELEVTFRTETFRSETFRTEGEMAVPVFRPRG